MQRERLMDEKIKAVEKWLNDALATYGAKYLESVLGSAGCTKDPEEEDFPNRLVDDLEIKVDVLHVASSYCSYDSFMAYQRKIVDDGFTRTTTLICSLYMPEDMVTAIYNGWEDAEDF